MKTSGLDATADQSAMNRHRLAPGHHVFETPDEGWLLYEPSGAFVRLHAPAEALRALTARLRGDDRSDVSEAVVEDLLARFEARGAIERQPIGRDTPGRSSLGEATSHRDVGAMGDPAIATKATEEGSRCVRIVGSGPIAVALGRLLEGEDGLEIAACRDDADLAETESPATFVSDEADLVIVCAGWLQDASWQALDEQARQHSIAWHSCYAEGDRFYLGPLWSPDDPTTVSYRDVRARRLASAPFPEGLEGYWRHLDERLCATPVRWPNAGGVAQLAGALAADVTAWARGETPPSHGHQLAFAPTSGIWTRHPVLPVPRGLMTERTDLAPEAAEAAR